MSLPVVMTSAGVLPQTAASLHSQVIDGAIALDPGLTANLPGTLIEDIASTDTSALVLIDQAQVETVNSMTPYGCNLFILNQLGQIYGVQQGVGSNTSVYVVFSGTPGYVIPQGVIVSDGTYQYLTQASGVISAGGTSDSVYCVSTSSGSWGVPANSVTTIVSSVPASITLTVTNPNTGIPSSTGQTPEQYRTQVLDAGLVTCSGTPNAIRTALASVSGVQQNLISIRERSNKWEVIVGGGDPYEVANAIFNSIGDPLTLIGSATTARNQNITIYNTPDSYVITYVVPVQQEVTIEIDWKTTATNAVSNDAVQALATEPVRAYLNNLYPGQPINEYELQYIFQEAIVSLVPTPLLTYIDITVTIDGSVVPPSAGTGVVEGDPEGYFFCPTTGVTTVKL